MEKTLIILIVLVLIIFIGAILFILINNRKKKICSLNYNLEIASSSITDNLKIKFDLVTKAINMIEKELKIESKKFEEVKKLKDDKTNNIKLDNILAEAKNEIFDIKDDYKKMNKVKGFKGIINDIKEQDILLLGAKKFYNEYATDYNNLIVSFPYKLFSKKLTYKQLYIEDIKNENLELGF